MRRHWWRALRHRLYEILEHGPVGDRTGRVVGRLIVLLIVVNRGCGHAGVGAGVRDALRRTGSWASSLCRLSSSRSSTDCECGSRSSTRPTCIRMAGKRASNTRPARLGLIDLFAVLPFWLAFVLPSRAQDPVSLPHHPFFKTRTLFAGHAFPA